MARSRVGSGGVLLFPKSFRLSGTATCGHPFNLRLNYPQSIAGQPRTASAEAEASQYQEFMALLASDQECGDCSANRILDYLGTQVTAVVTTFDVPSPPPLVGSLRQVAWAEQERVDLMWQRILSPAVHVVERMFCYPTVGELLVREAARSMWPDPEGDSVPSDLTQLATTVDDFLTRFSMHLSTPVRGVGPASAGGEATIPLASWLLIRRRWPFPDESWWCEDRATAWIARSRRNRAVSGQGEARVPVPIAEVSAAALVTSWLAWPDRHTMEAAFDTVLAPGSRLPVDYAVAHSREPFTGIAEEIAVLQALDTPRQRTC